MKAKLLSTAIGCVLQTRSGSNSGSNSVSTMVVVDRWFFCRTNIGSFLLFHDTRWTIASLSVYYKNKDNSNAMPINNT